MKEFIKQVKEHPKEFVQEVARCVMVLAVCGVLLFLPAIFQSCSVQRESTSSGKAVIITTDTTYIYHGGTVKFPKTK